jgi:ferredoxin--NADP+ reductase
MPLIIDKFALSSTITWFEIEAKDIAKNYLPGQFIILRVDALGERIPLTIVSVTDHSICLIVQAIGASTKQLCKMAIGEDILDVVGPLGNPIETLDVDSIIAIAGGVGAAPLYPQLKHHYENGVKIDLILGAKTKDYLILETLFKDIVHRVIITTDDGSKGHKGFVTDALKQQLKTTQYDLAIAIGPLVMMQACVNINKAHNLSTYVSLNPIMIDGTGMCGNCRVTIGNETRFACIDGPDFLGDEIDFDELIIRQKTYTEEEEKCQLRWQKHEQ